MEHGALMACGQPFACARLPLQQRRRSGSRPTVCGARWMRPVVDGAARLRSRVEAWRAKTRLVSGLQAASHLDFRRARRLKNTVKS